MIVKKKSPTKIIESTFNPKIEHTFAKLRGKELEDHTSKFSSETRAIQTTIYSEKPYTHIHTHPTSVPKVKRSILETFFPRLFHLDKTYDEREELNYSGMPSGPDLYIFLRKNKLKTMIIAVREGDTGKVRGYTFVRKTKKTPKIKFFGRWGNDITEYSKVVIGSNLGEVHSAFKNFTGKYNLQYRHLPAESYQLNETKTQFVRKKELEHIISTIIGIVVIGISLFFLDSSITGNAIGSSSKSSGSWIGIVLFLIGIAVAIFWFSKKR